MVKLFKDMFRSKEEQKAVEIKSVQSGDTEVKAITENAPATEKKAKDSGCCGGCS